MGKKLLKKNGKIVLNNDGIVAIKPDTLEIDGYEYKTVKMPDGRIWMAENLRCSIPGYTVKSVNGKDYYGKYYTIPAMLSRKIDGWHIPSKAEWDALYASVGSDNSKLKSTTGWAYSGNGTDDYGFCLYPAGYFDGDKDNTDQPYKCWHMRYEAGNNTTTFIEVTYDTTFKTNSYWDSNWRDTTYFPVRLIKDA